MAAVVCDDPNTPARITPMNTAGSAFNASPNLATQAPANPNAHPMIAQMAVTSTATPRLTTIPRAMRVTKSRPT